MVFVATAFSRTYRFSLVFLKLRCVTDLSGHPAAVLSMSSSFLNTAKTRRPEVVRQQADNEVRLKT